MSFFQGPEPKTVVRRSPQVARAAIRRRESRMADRGARVAAGAFYSVPEHTYAYGKANKSMVEAIRSKIGPDD